MYKNSMKAKIDVYMYRQLLACNSLEGESKYGCCMRKAQLNLLYMIRLIMDQSSLPVL